MGYLVQKYIVEDPGEASPIMPQHVVLVGPDGASALPGGASASRAGLVKKAGPVADVESGDLVAASGDYVSKAEYDKAVALANELKCKVNELLASLRSAGTIS